MSNSSVTLADVESFMALRKRGLAFPPALERQFQADTRDRRSERLTQGILATAAIYNLFLFADWVLLPDMLWCAVALHACITPLMLAAAYIISRHQSYLVREWLAASVPVMIALQIEYCFAVTQSALAAHYQYLLLSTLLYANVSLHRLSFPFARAFSVALCWAMLPWSWAGPFFRPTCR